VTTNCTLVLPETLILLTAALAGVVEVARSEAAKAEQINDLLLKVTAAVDVL
jgi:ribose/xylose/arabinose/galactoside ABC-type transport system permease subunit